MLLLYALADSQQEHTTTAYKKVKQSKYYIPGKLRNFILLLFISLFALSCFGQVDSSGKSDNAFVLIYKLNNKINSDTIIVEDSSLLTELHRMRLDVRYKAEGWDEDDTVYNELNKPVLIKSGDDVFGAHIQLFKYDTLNRLLRIIGIDKNGSIQPFYHDVAIEKYKYDRNNNIIEIRSYGKDEKLISTEFEDTPIIKKVYDEKNRVIEEWYLDERGKLRKPYAIIKFNYSESGEQIVDGWYNKKGRKQKE